MAARIKKGDKVVVITGRDKGRSGEVIKVMPKESRALVRGVNMVTRHQQQTAAQQGGLVRKEAPIHLSNIAIADPIDGKPTRVGFKTLEDGRKVRCRQALGRDHQWLKAEKRERLGYEPRLQKYYREVVVPKLNEQFGYKNPLQRAAHRQDRAEHGRRRGDRRHQEGAARGRRPGDDRRAEAGHHACAASRSPPSRCARACRSAPR